MKFFVYDKSFDGLLTAVFDAYFRKTFPDDLLSEGDALPLFYDELHTVVTDEEKAGRVWRGLQKKVSTSALGCLTQSWLSELPEVGMLIFRYIRKAIDSPRSIETNFGDPDVLRLAQIWKKVDGERVHLMQLSVFRKLRMVHSLRLSNRSIMRFLLPFTISKTVLPIRSGLSTT